MAVNVVSYVNDQSLDISSEQDARLFVSGLANYDVSKLEKDQLSNLLTRLKTIELQFPNCTTPEFDQSLNNVVDRTMALLGSNDVELKGLFTDSSLKAQQMMISKMDESQQQTYIRQVSISRLKDRFESSVSGMVSEESINESQLQFKSAVEEELILMENPAEKTEFIKELNQTLFGAAIKNSKTPAQNALHLASFRGLQQALEGDAELAGDPTLTNSLNDNVKSYLLSLRSTQQLPVSDRSFDHMIHFLKSSNQSEATGFFKVLGQKMSPNQFDRLYTRVAKHAQINGDDLSRQMLLKAVSESRQERFQSLSFNQRRKINELSASSKQELSGKISDLVNSREFTDSEKSQICSELLVQNPKQFKRALGHLNKLAKDAPATKISGLKAPVAPEGVAGKSAGQITQQSDVPSLPTRVAGDVPSLPTRLSGDRPSFPTQTTDGVTAPIAPQSETDTVSNSALNILADTLADVMSDSGKKVIFESLKGGRYGNPFSSMGYSSLAIGYEMVSFIANGGYIVKGLSNAASLFDKITGNFISNRASEMASGLSMSSGVSFIDKQLKVSEYNKELIMNTLKRPVTPLNIIASKVTMIIS